MKPLPCSEETLLEGDPEVTLQTGMKRQVHKIQKLKGHGNEADFLGFLQKLVPHRSLTLPFEPFRFRLQIRGDILNRKTTPRLGDSASRRLSDSASRGVDDSPTLRVGSRLLNV